MLGKKTDKWKMISVRKGTYERLEGIKSDSFDKTINILLDQAKTKTKEVTILDIPEVN